MCKCKVIECADRRCGCLKYNKRCSVLCECVNCTNGQPNINRTMFYNDNSMLSTNIEPRAMSTYNFPLNPPLYFGNNASNVGGRDTTLFLPTSTVNHDMMLSSRDEGVSYTDGIDNGVDRVRINEDGICQTDMSINRRVNNVSDMGSIVQQGKVEVEGCKEMVDVNVMTEEVVDNGNAESDEGIIRESKNDKNNKGLGSDKCNFEGRENEHGRVSDMFTNQYAANPFLNEYTPNRAPNLFITRINDLETQKPNLLLGNFFNHRHETRTSENTKEPVGLPSNNASPFNTNQRQLNDFVVNGANAIKNTPVGHISSTNNACDAKGAQSEIIQPTVTQTDNVIPDTLPHAINNGTEAIQQSTSKISIDINPNSITITNNYYGHINDDTIQTHSNLTATLLASKITANRSVSIVNNYHKPVTTIDQTISNCETWLMDTLALICTVVVAMCLKAQQIWNRVPLANKRLLYTAIICLIVVVGLYMAVSGHRREVGRERGWYRKARADRKDRWGHYMNQSSNRSRDDYRNRPHYVRYDL